MNDFAIASWVIAAASTVTAAAIWLIPFFGWIAEAFAAADSVIDWITANTAQAAYDDTSVEAYQLGNTFMSWVNRFISPVFLVNDLVGIMGIFKTTQKILVKLVEVVSSDFATNLAGAFAEPEEDAELLADGTVFFGTMVDLASSVVTYWSTATSNSINNLESYITEAANR